MQFLNESLLLALKNNLNISQIQNISTMYVDGLFNFFKKDKILDEYYDEYYNDMFPMYPFNNYKIISSLKNFSSMKIKTVIDDNLDVIRNNLNSKVLATKSYTDNIPENDELLKISNYLQNMIYKPSYINYDFLNFPRSSFSKDQDLISYILNTSEIPTYHNSLNSFSAVDIFILYESLLYIFNNSTNFYNGIITNLYDLNNISKSLIKNDFYEFINYNYRNVHPSSILDKLLSTFVLKNNFDIFAPSNNVQTKFRNFIKSDIYPDLINTFNDFVDNDIQEDFKKEFNLNYINIIRSMSFYYIFEDIITDDINLFFLGTRDRRLDKIFSQNYINNFLNQYKTGNNMKNYLMPVYLYKNDCLKCLNTIQAFIRLYFENELKSKVEYIWEYRYKGETKSIINSILSKLNKSHIKSYFDSINLSQHCKDNNIPQFISFLFGNDILQRFCNSQKFNNFIISFLNKSNDYLYKERLINYGYNWYVNVELIRHYFLVYFLEHINLMDNNNIRKNIIFQNLESNISMLLDDDLQFSATEDSVKHTLLSLRNNSGVIDSTYNLCGNLLEGMIVRQIYFQVLSYFSNE